MAWHVYIHIFTNTINNYAKIISPPLVQLQYVWYWFMLHCQNHANYKTAVACGLQVYCFGWIRRKCLFSISIGYGATKQITATCVCMCVYVHCKKIILTMFCFVSCTNINQKTIF